MWLRDTNTDNQPLVSLKVAGNIWFSFLRLVRAPPMHLQHFIKQYLCFSVSSDIAHNCGPFKNVPLYHNTNTHVKCAVPAAHRAMMCLHIARTHPVQSILAIYVSFFCRSTAGPWSCQPSCCSEIKWPLFLPENECKSCYICWEQKKVQALGNFVV